MNKHYLIYAALLLVVAVIAALYFADKRLSVSIAIGWAIALLNYSLLRWSTRRVIMNRRSQFLLVPMNMMRLGLVFIAVIILLSLKMANVIGLFVGLALINVVIMIDGYINRRGLG
ncbi:ATPase, F0 complex, subunit I, proteobacteria-type [Candidatus Magnetobacterium bavaricum]|uniref:ATPase, F0 complex, subunit I, proteobacteria-type n=1 Tax=Candidatus Magnetobacterium bavaricum TaxID=29290 RepID=A0A0F3GXC5_9BACT|nr:ATPase, F0 complex, subunit I, proteobacteria-type [Candidatus Magnetobacterium bavaricum]